MKAVYDNIRGDYKITLTRKEAETLAYAYTSYNNLLTALKLWPDSDSFTIYGSKVAVVFDLVKAMKP